MRRKDWIPNFEWHQRTGKMLQDDYVKYMEIVKLLADRSVWKHEIEYTWRRVAHDINSARATLHRALFKDYPAQATPEVYYPNLHQQEDNDSAPKAESKTSTEAIPRGGIIELKNLWPENRARGVLITK